MPNLNPQIFFVLHILKSRPTSGAHFKRVKYYPTIYPIFPLDFSKFRIAFTSSLEKF